MASWAKERFPSVALGYAVASGASGIFLVLFVLLSPDNKRPLLDDLGSFPLFGVIATLFTAVLAASFAAPLVYIAERWKIRSVAFYAMTGAVTGPVALILMNGGYERLSFEDFVMVFIGGLIAGFVYWRIAGRQAGRAA
jgi:hypothetical protein